MYEILVLIIPLITSPYVSRILGAEKLGIYSFTYNMAFYFGLFCMLGVKNFGNREIAKCKGNKKELGEKFINIYAVQLFFSIIVIISYYIFINLCFEEYKIFFFINFLHIFANMIDITWFFNGLEEFKITVTRNSIIKILSFILIFSIVKNENDLWKYCLIIVASNFISQLFLWTQIYKYIEKCKITFSKVKKNLKPMLILFIPVISVSLYNVMDKIMIGIFSNTIQLGYYENAEKIIFCIKTVITSLGVVMLPRMSKLQAEKKDNKSNQYIEYSIVSVMLIAFAIAFGISSVANQFAIIYWGDEFLDSGKLLMGLCIGLPFSAFANVIRTQYLLPNNFDKEYAYSVSLGAIVNLILNIYLIPKMMALGAVIATVITEIIVCCYQCLAVKNALNIKKFLKKTYMFLIFGIIMYSVVFFFNNKLEKNIYNFIFKIIIGAIVYCSLSIVYLIKNEKELLYNILPSKYRTKLMKFEKEV